MCTLLKDCTSGKVESLVACTCIVEEPLAERIAVGVAARDKMSVMWAMKIVLAGCTHNEARLEALGPRRQRHGGVNIGGKELTIVHGVRGEILLRLEQIVMLDLAKWAKDIGFVFISYHGYRSINCSG